MRRKIHDTKGWLCGQTHFNLRFAAFAYILLSNDLHDDTFTQNASRSNLAAGLFCMEPGGSAAVVSLLCTAVPVFAASFSWLAVDAAAAVWGEAWAGVPFLSQVADLGSLEPDMRGPGERG